MRAGVNGITLWKPSSTALLDTAEQGARYDAVCTSCVSVVRHLWCTASPQVPRQASVPSCSCCVIYYSRLSKLEVCRRGSNHPFTGASEHAPPLPAEVQAERWAEDYDSYKVSRRA